MRLGAEPCTFCSSMVQSIDPRKKQRVTLALRAGRLSWNAIAEQEGVSRTTVRRIAKQLGMQPSAKPVRREAGRQAQQARLKERAERYAKLRKTGLTCVAIGLAQDPPVSGGSVRALLVKHGLWQAQTVAERSKMAVARARAFVAKRRAGLSATEIGAAETPSITASSVRSAIRRAGLSLPGLRAAGHR